MRRHPLTVRGAEKLRSELQSLKSNARPKIIEAIAEARAHGDLKENAEYHAAKEQQAFIEGRIRELEDKVSSAEIIDPRTVNANGKIVFGTTVGLLNVETSAEVRYQIVGELEADVDAGLVSIVSPIARALIGKGEGDPIVVDTPRGEVEYEVVSVEYL